MPSYTRTPFTLSMIALFAVGVSACVPADQLVVTQENLKAVKDEVVEDLNTSIDETVEAISDRVDKITGNDGGDNALLADEEAASPQGDSTIVVAAIEEEQEVLPPSLDPKTFLGKSADDLGITLGKEDYRRLDQGVLVLQFRMPSCIIDFVIAENDRIQSYHGRHRVSGENYNDTTCQYELAARRNAQ